MRGGEEVGWGRRGGGLREERRWVEGRRGGALGEERRWVEGRRGGG